MIAKAKGVSFPIFLFVALSVAVSPAWSLDLKDGTKLTAQNNFLYSNNHISGSNPSGSFLSPGDHFTENLSLQAQSKPGPFKWDGAMDGRMTDDDRIESRRFRLKRFFLKGQTERQTGVVGDFFGSFSQYSLNASLKGLRYSAKLPGQVELTALGGTSKTNWDDLWEHNSAESLDRQVYGLRAARAFERDAFIGIHGVATQDSRAKGNASATAQDQRLGGAEWALPTWANLRVYGESAFAKTENDTPATTDTSAHGWAHLVKGDYRLMRWRTQNDFEKVSRDFQTNVGAAASDQIHARTQNRIGLKGPLSFLFNLSWFHNNLVGDPAVNTVKNIIPEGGLRYDGPDWRPSLSVDSKFRHRETHGSQTDLRTRTRSWITSLADRYGIVSGQFDYELQWEDRSDRSQEGVHHIVGFALSAAPAVGPSWKLFPSLRYNLQRDRDSLLAKTDQTSLWNFGLTARSEWGLDFGAGYSRNLALPASTSGSDRRTVSASAGYNWHNKPDHRLEVRFRQNDNRFDAAAQDFKEAIWEVGLNNRF